MEIQIDEEQKGNKIVLEEIPKVKQVHTCNNCGKEYKTRSGLYKHNQKCIPVEEEEGESEAETEYYDEEQEEQTEETIDQERVLRYKLQNELKQLYMNNPSSVNLNKPLYFTDIEVINQMSIEELQMRIIDAKLTFSKKLDMKVSDTALTLTNQVVGGLLGCIDELEQEVQKDEILREATKDLLSFKILNHIPMELKVSGLYSLNVATAVKKSKLRKQREQVMKVENIEDN